MAGCALDGVSTSACRLVQEMKIQPFPTQKCKKKKERQDFPPPPPRPLLFLKKKFFHNRFYRIHASEGKKALARLQNLTLKNEKNYFLPT